MEPKGAKLIRQLQPQLKRMEFDVTNQVYISVLLNSFRRAYKIVGLLGEL